ncbi:hypothetical protein CB1_000597012 [Camelus ferus]|nr:hypothetical protein CB1_000597012 [Camelus ferus]
MALLGCCDFRLTPLGIAPVVTGQWPGPLPEGSTVGRTSGEMRWVSGALKVIPEVKLEGLLGGSVIIECPLPERDVRLYLCRKAAQSGICSTVVSNRNFVSEEYKHRVTLELCPDRHLFLVEVTELTRSDSGVYACGVGMNTDRGKTQQVTLIVHSAREELLRPQTASYNHQTRLHRQRAFNHSPGRMSAMEDQGFHILIPTILSLILLAFMGLLAKRVIQRRKALSRRVRRLAVRMRALEASQRPVSQRPRVSETPWLHAPSLKVNCEYVSFYHQPAAKMEDSDSNDYINIPCLTQLSSHPPGPRPGCQ